MRIALLFVTAMLLSGCVTTPDPIDRLVIKLSSSHGLWQNGLAPILSLPATAPTGQVVSQVFKMTGFDRGYVTSQKIVKVRKVHIPGSLPDLYTAVIVDTDFGRKIVLLQYQGGLLNWWSRVYDIEPSGS